MITYARHFSLTYYKKKPADIGKLRENPLDVAGGVIPGEMICGHCTIKKEVVEIYSGTGPSPCSVYWHCSSRHRWDAMI